MTKARVPHRFDANGTARKRCSNCKYWKPVGFFSKEKAKWDGLKSACKECGRAQKIKSDKEYYRKNKAKINAQNRKYREKNKEKLTAKKREYIEKNKGKVAARIRKYRKKNKEKINQQRNLQRKKRRKEDPQYRLTANMRKALYHSLKRAKTKKQNTTFKYISCSPSFLLERLEKMRIERGLSEYAVDHMMPLDSFDLSDPEELRRAWHFSNLQSLSGEDNFKKSNKVIYDMKWCTKRDQWLIRNKDNKGPYRPTALFQSLLLV